MTHLKNLLVCFLLLASCVALTAADTEEKSNETDVRAAAAASQCLSTASAVGVQVPNTYCTYQPTQTQKNRYHYELKGTNPTDPAILRIKVGHERWICRGKPGPCVTKGGPLGGDLERFDSVLRLEITGDGPLKGYSRVIELPAETITATGPRDPFGDFQNFQTEMVSLNASLEGDEDFEQLTITAGTDNGFASSGQTIITYVSNGFFAIDSYIGIDFEIAFQGAGRLEGLNAQSRSHITMGAVASE